MFTLQKYLITFGYVPDGVTIGEFSTDDMKTKRENSIKEFQHMAGLPQTGQLIKPYICGLRDECVPFKTVDC